MKEKRICQYEKCQKEFIYNTKNNKKSNRTGIYCSRPCNLTDNFDPERLSKARKKRHKDTNIKLYKYDKNGRPIEKICPQCNKYLPIENFLIELRSVMNLRSSCIRCEGISRLMRKMGTPKEIAELLVDKNLPCELCGSLKKVCADHCHETKTYRGALCGKCNSAAGFLNDDYEQAFRLAKYLEKHHKKEEGASHGNI